MICLIKVDGRRDQDRYEPDLTGFHRSLINRVERHTEKSD